MNFGRPDPSFSVAIQDTFLSRQNGIMSAVILTSAGASPFLQRRIKQRKFTTRNAHATKVYNCGRNHFKHILLWFLPFLFLNCAPQAYAIPGTNYAFLGGHQSNDLGRQNKYIKTIIDGFRRKSDNDDNPSCNSAEQNINNVATTTPLTSVSPSTALKNEPFCFVVDTDSIPFILDTGANRIIVNDAKLLSCLSPSTTKVKGIEGHCIRIQGHGKISIPLRSDANEVDIIKDLDAVLLPSSPYNIIPPQLFINEMKRRNFEVSYSEHDDNEYIFHYKSSSSSAYRKLTIPIGDNQLFLFRTNEGYRNFMSRASKYNKTFSCFAGEVHTIQENDKSSLSHSAPISNPSTLPREHTSSKTREPSPHKTREPTCVPCTTPITDSDYKSLAKEPQSADFISPSSESFKYDPAVEAVHRKQFRLQTIHERLGHLSFATLKLMAKCGLISKDLEHVDPPKCPGCAYGKARRKKR